MVKLPQTILKDELGKARNKGLHQIPRIQLIRRFQLEGYGLEKAKKWVDELLDLCYEMRESGPYLDF